MPDDCKRSGSSSTMNKEEFQEVVKESLVKEEEAKKRKRKKSKRKRRHHPLEECGSVGDKSDSRERKKKTLSENNANHAGENCQESQIVESLEGALFDGEMILVDRNSGKVFSGLERTESGERKEIGKLSKSGSVILNKSKRDPTETGERKTPEFPFETDSDDHCESPLQAYHDVAPFLQDIQNYSGDEIFIYDPYFCNGTVVRNLQSIGFNNVYNKKEDCYKIWRTPSYPPHDILLTNPPYSGDHIERLIDHVTSKSFGNRPWMLLMPQWVHKKDYYTSKTKGIRPFYVVPRKRYVYLPPPSFRESKKSDVHKKSSPFVSMWFIWGGTAQQNERWLSTIARRVTNCDVARSKSALRDLRRKKK